MNIFKDICSNIFFIYSENNKVSKLNISNYKDFLLESIIPVLDMVIDFNGNIYDNSDNYKLVKGHVEKKSNKVVSITGDNGIKYAAGIDKNGKLITVDSIEPLKMPERLKDKFGEYWNTDVDYFELLPLVGTGWVNAKIDLEVVKRIRRYSMQLGNNKSTDPIEVFKSKMNDFNHTLNIKDRARSTTKIQKEMSSLIILHHLKEIKDFFTPSSAGFLLESFIAGLLPKSKVSDDNSPIDIISNGVNLQIKFYLPSGSFKVPNKLIIGIDETEDSAMKRWKKNNSEKLIIALKYSDRIVFAIIDLIPNVVSPNHFSNFLVKGSNKPSTKVSISKIRNAIDSNEIDSYEIPVLNIEDKIDKISKGLKGILDNLYGELSKFQYNIETIISGVNEKGKILDDVEFTNVSNSSEVNLRLMKDELDNLVTNMKLK